MLENNLHHLMATQYAAAGGDPSEIIDAYAALMTLIEATQNYLLLNGDAFTRNLVALP